MRLEGQVAIVTGSGQGIGEAIALTLAKEGAIVVVNDINFESAKRVSDEIKSQGGQSEPIKVDVTNKQEVNQLVEKTLDSWQKIDILVNNAGITKLKRVLEMTEAEWDSVIDVNLKGQFLCSQAVAKHMIKQDRGKIVNIASQSAYIGYPGAAAYAASKGGVAQLTKVLAVELGKYNINVNAVAPGLVMTALVEAAAKENPNFVGGIDRIPLKRLAKPEDIANAVLFLASSESDYITGQVIIVDGGILAIHPRLVKPTE
ncbi:SDR family NAD(P)-dependent oxidoreductase [Chloroflexota bacterium]